MKDTRIYDCDLDNALIKDCDRVYYYAFIARQRELTANERIALAVIFQFIVSGENHIFYGGSRYLSIYVGCAESTAKNIPKSLTKKGYLKRLTNRGKQAVYTYGDRLKDFFNLIVYGDYNLGNKGYTIMQANG